VKCLLEGQSDIVICQRQSDLVATDINYALILDRMYKKKLKDGDLDPFTEEQIAAMKRVCDRKLELIRSMASAVETIGL
jgi:hypothetical protein